MRVLLIGDVVAQTGCEFVRKHLPHIKRTYGVDVTIVNAENSAVGNGVLPSSAEYLFQSGADVLTTGNHVYKRKEIFSFLDETEAIVRPANFPAEAPGVGFYRYDGGSFSLLVINLLGTSFMEPLENPFTTIDRILKEQRATYTVVDFHAEATGEKKALGFYLDGRVSAVIGTHTHVQTADEQILPGGTGYLTDVGMTGPLYSALGIKPECVIRRLRTHLPTRFEVEDTVVCEMDGVLLTLDPKTGLCSEIERLQIR